VFFYAKRGTNARGLASVQLPIIVSVAATWASVLSLQLLKGKYDMRTQFFYEGRIFDFSMTACYHVFRYIYLCQL